MYCFIRSVMMSAKASLVILEAVGLVMKPNIESTSGRLWLMPFKWSIASNIFGLKWDILILAFKSEWVIASFSKATFISFSDDVLIVKVKNVLYKTIKTIDWLKLGPGTELYKRNTTISKKFNDEVISANCDVIAFFPIYG